MKKISNKKKIELFTRIENAIYQIDKSLVFQDEHFDKLLEAMLDICLVLGEDIELIAEATPLFPEVNWGLKEIFHQFTNLIFNDLTRANTFTVFFYTFHYYLKKMPHSLMIIQSFVIEHREK